MTTGGSTDRRLAILVITFLSGVLGGLLAGLLGNNRWWFISWEWHVLSVALGAVISTGTALFLLTTERPDPGPETPPAERPAELPQPEGPAYSWPAVQSLPPSQGTRMRPVAPIAQKSEPERQPVAAHHRFALPPTGNSSLLNSDVASDLIAQCPRCGEFRLDVNEVARAYAFQCRNGPCGNTWSWTPGTSWPPVVVRRNLPTASAPDGAGAKWS